jgi:hypothetical protein
MGHKIFGFLILKNLCWSYVNIKGEEGGVNDIFGLRKDDYKKNGSQDFWLSNIEEFVLVLRIYLRGRGGSE